mgnify:CR=1 FL=1
MPTLSQITVEFIFTHCRDFFQTEDAISPSFTKPRHNVGLWQLAAGDCGGRNGNQGGNHFATFADVYRLSFLNPRFDSRKFIWWCK